jgi:hypothetical protein
MLNLAIFIDILKLFFLLKKPFHAAADSAIEVGPFLLKADTYKKYIDEFNIRDNELHSQHIANHESWKFLQSNIPLFTCPDAEIEKTYYFRWWTYRKHIKYIGDFIPERHLPYVVTEFLPNVSWARLFNTIPCAAAHHIMEGRWLHDNDIIDSYSRFWFSSYGQPRAYSFWAAYAMYSRALVNNDDAFLAEMLPQLVNFHELLKKTNYDERRGLYFNTDNR